MERRRGERMFGTNPVMPYNYGLGASPPIAGDLALAMPDAAPPPDLGSGPLPRNAPSVAGSAKAAVGGGMFGPPQKQNFLQKFGPVIAMALIGATARNNPAAGAQMQAIMQGMATRAKNAHEDEQTRNYVSALVAQGMDPNQAAILAADPQEMAKHFGTRFDAATIDEGSSRYVPNLDGSANVFTSPKTFKEGADVVQMPGSQMVAPAFSGLPAGPQQIGAPANIPGLRTEAEQYADSIAQRGSPEWQSAVSNYTLKSYGPAAHTMLGDRLQALRDIAAGHDATSRGNNIRTTGTSAANNIRSTSTSSANNARTTGQSNTNNLRTTGTSAANNAANNETRLRTSRTVRALPNEPVAVGPGGKKLVVRNGQWVPAE